MKYSVLTYIINDYEPVRETVNKDPDVEYILVTDNPNIKSDTWTVIYDESLLKMKVFERCYYVRYNPFKYCSSDIVIKIDGSMKLVGSLDRLVDKFNEDNSDFATVVHPWRNNLYDEYVAWIRSRNYSNEHATAIMNEMYRMGYHSQKELGLFQVGFFIQRKNKVNDDINALTYSFIRYFGTDDVERIDQTVFSFIIKKFFTDKVKVLPLSQHVLESDYLRIHAHNSQVQYKFPFDKMPYAEEGYVMNEMRKLYY